MGSLNHYNNKCTLDIYWHQAFYSLPQFVSWFPVVCYFFLLWVSHNIFSQQQKNSHSMRRLLRIITPPIPTILVSESIQNPPQCVYTLTPCGRVPRQSAHHCRPSKPTCCSCRTSKANSCQTLPKRMEYTMMMIIITMMFHFYSRMNQKTMIQCLETMVMGIRFGQQRQEQFPLSHQLPQPIPRCCHAIISQLKESIQ